MANPVKKVCYESQWTKVASNVTIGVIEKLKRAASLHYFQTYRVTGDPAPNDISECVQMFLNYNFENINSDSGIDVYIYCSGGNGLVRVDLPS